MAAESPLASSTTLLESLYHAPGARLVVRDGSFDVDEAQARELLGWMRLEDPRRYVLELVQVASLLGTSFVTMHIDTTLLHVSFNGECFDASDLDDLYAAAFRASRSPRDEALRHLALALGSVQALHPSLIEIDARGRHTAHTLSIRHGASDALDTRPHDGLEGTSIKVRQRPQWRHARVLFESVFDYQFEVELLREHCRFARFPLLVNQQRLSHGLRLERACDVQVEWRDARSQGVLGISFEERVSQIFWVRHGVLVHTQRVEHEGFCVDAVIEAPELRLDLSMSAVVEDQSWHELQRHVLDDQTHRALRRALEPLMRDDALQISRHALNSLGDSCAWGARLDVLLLRRIVRDVCVNAGRTKSRRDVIPAHTRVLLTLFERARLWPAATRVEEDDPWVRSQVSMQDLGVGLEAGSTLYTSYERLPVHYFPDGRHVLWVRDYDRERPHLLMRDYLGVESVDVTEPMQRMHLCNLNRHAWRARRSWQGLDPKRHVVLMKRTFELGSVELGLIAGGRSHAECVLAPQGKVMRTLKLEHVAPVQATLVWCGELQPGELYDDVERDERVWRFALESLEMWSEAISAWCEGLEEPVSTGTRRALLATLVQWAEGQEGAALLGELGVWTRAYAARYLARRSERQATGLFGLSAYLARTHRSDSELVRLRERLGKAGMVALCETVSGKLVPLVDVLSSALELGKIAVISEHGLDEARRNWRHAEVERLVVVLDEMTGRLIRALCGPDRVLVFDGELARMAGERRFLAMREERAELTRSVLAKVSFEEAGCRGEVGLLDGHLDVPGRCEVRVLYLGRRVAVATLPVPCGRMLAVVDDEALQPRADWRGVMEDERYAHMLERVSAAASQVYHEYLTSQAERHGTVDANAAWFCMMCRLGGLGAQSGERLSMFVASHPVWRLASGERMGLAAIKDRHEGRPDLLWATPSMLRSDADEIWQGVEKSRVLVVPENLARVDTWLLECIEGRHRIVSVKELGEDAHRLETARGRFLDREVVEVELDGQAYLETLRFAGVGRHGKIGLRVDEAPLLCRGEVNVVWMNENRRVMKSRVPVMLGVFDAVWEDEALIDWARSDEVQRDVLARAVPEIEARAREVWRAYVHRMCESPELMTDAARHMALMYLWQCRERSTELAIVSLLESLPLCVDGVGAHWSVAELRQLEEVACTWSAQDAGAGDVIVRDEAQRRALKGAILPVPLVEVMPAVQQDRPLQGAARVEVTARALSPEDLPGQIQHRIEEVCGEALYLRDPERTRGLEVLEIDTGGATAIARGDGVWLARQSAIVQAWYDAPDSLWLAVAVSAAYSAMNLYEERVTDGHEQEFLCKLAAWSVARDDRV